LKCVHHYATRTGYALKEKLTADNIEAFLVEVQRHTLSKNFHSTDILRINAEIARLWAEDINKARKGMGIRVVGRLIQDNNLIIVEAKHIEFRYELNKKKNQKDHLFEEENNIE